MYDANPRRHLQRAKDVLSHTDPADYPRLRYAALDLRLAIETTFQEILTACYSEFLEKFKGLYQAREFIGEIRKQNPDFDLTNQLVPLVIYINKKISDYPKLDLNRLSSMNGQLGDHLHHLNRYDVKKGSKDRAAMLGVLLNETSGYLTSLLQHERYWVKFYDRDQKFFEDVLSGKQSMEAFEAHIKTGRLKSYMVKNVHHLQESVQTEGVK